MEALEIEKEKAHNQVKDLQKKAKDIAKFHNRTSALEKELRKCQADHLAAVQRLAAMTDLWASQLKLNRELENGIQD